MHRFLIASLTLFACPLSAARVYAQPSGPIFVDVAQEIGLEFEHQNGMSGEQYLPEIMGGGGALLDYDNDGDLDLFVVQGSTHFGPKRAEPVLSDRLYENLWIEGGSPSGRLHFRDVTDTSGIQSTGYGMGAIAADFDLDGKTDLYVLNLGPNRLLRNLGNGRFEDLTEASGAGGSDWSVAAATFTRQDQATKEITGLDLYVVNYVDFRFYRHKRCPHQTSKLDYCGPLNFPAAADRWLAWAGGWKFRLQPPAVKNPGRGLGVFAADLNDDQAIDLFVANDQMPNQLLLRTGERFIDEALLSGLALNAEGREEASMGVDAQDFDGDGDRDLVVTHLHEETNTLYLNEGNGLFRDVTNVSGIGPISLPRTGFGVAYLDYDNDGWLDLAIANGAINTVDASSEHSDFPLDEPHQLLHNVAGGALGRRFEDVSDLAGDGLTRRSVGRGLARGDLDNDGDPDLVLFSNNGPLRVLENVTGATGRDWIGLASDPPSHLRGLIATVKGAGLARVRYSNREGSYATSHDPRVLVGLGDGSKAESLEVMLQWPNRKPKTLQLTKNRYHRVVRPPASSEVP